MRFVPGIVVEEEVVIPAAKPKVHSTIGYVVHDWSEEETYGTFGTKQEAQSWVDNYMNVDEDGEEVFIDDHEIFAVKGKIGFAG